MSDLKSKKAIYFKAFLFLLIIIMTSVLLLFEEVLWKRAVYILSLIWASARLYYFMFYVIEKYVDSEYKFSSIYSFLKYLFNKDSHNL